MQLIKQKLLSVFLFILIVLAGLLPPQIFAQVQTKSTGGSTTNVDGSVTVIIGADSSLPEKSIFGITGRSVNDLLTGNSLGQKGIFNFPKMATAGGASVLYEVDPSDASTSAHFASFPKPFTVVLKTDQLDGGSTDNVENKSFNVLFFDPVAKNWQFLPTSVITNAKNKTAAFVTQRAGIYTLVKNTNTTAEAMAKDIKNANIDGCHYIVESGDSLWSIARRRLGNGVLYTKIIDQNKAKYPGLNEQTKLQLGWEFKVDCNH